MNLYSITLFTEQTLFVSAENYTDCIQKISNIKNVQSITEIARYQENIDAYVEYRRDRRDGMLKFYALRN